MPATKAPRPPTGDAWLHEISTTAFAWSPEAGRGSHLQ
jgi:hypothetical protein